MRAAYIRVMQAALVMIMSDVTAENAVTENLQIK